MQVNIKGKPVAVVPITHIEQIAFSQQSQSLDDTMTQCRA